MNLQVNINRLTRQHLTTGAEGKPIQVAALLDQLSAAIHPSQAGGASGGSKIRVPIDTKAMSLLQDIEREARDHQREMEGFTDYPLAGLIQSWAIIEGEWADFLEHVTLGWCDKIGELLEPAKPYRPSHACPSCDQRFHGEENAPTLAVYFRDEDGNQRHPHDWRMECAACGAMWQGKELGHIAHAIKEAA